MKTLKWFAKIGVASIVAGGLFNRFAPAELKRAING